MARSSESNATPEMLKWARLTAGLSIEDVASAEKLHSETIQEWEQGVRLPTYAQLEKLAKRYKRPVMVFFLEAPPSEFNVVKDYRTVASGAKVQSSTECVLAIRRIQEQQAWAASYLADEGSESLEFVGKFSSFGNPSDLAVAIRSLLGVQMTEQSECSSDLECFRMWRDRCESIGVLVFCFAGVAVDEMRGFAIAHSVAPVVAVNAKDNYPARSFSLLHELVHILLGDSGISTRSRAALSEHGIERFCESVAAETLMPMDDFRRKLPHRITDLDYLVDQLAKYYWSSKTAVLYRLADAGHLSLSEAFEYASRYIAKEPQKSTGPIPQATLSLGRNGRYFSRVAISAYQGGDIHGGQLSTLLGLSMKYLPTLESHLNPSQVHVETG